MSTMPSIDVVIPVYNAPALTRRCIDSVVGRLGRSIRRIHIQDDASGIETREMLDNLPFAEVCVHHAQKNQGFGASVNEAIERSDASYILVLNSDTEAHEDFLPLLCSTLAADPQLAVIIPAGNDYFDYDLDRYVRRPGGYIQTYRFRGHAFLIRREAFQEACGFDPIFGRGYYEDVDLGRRLDLRGWRLGVHPDAHIQHKGGGSFGRGRAFRRLAQRNRSLYFLRYPNAKRNILLVSGNCPLTYFSSNLLDALEGIFREGRYVHWLTPNPAAQLLCLQMLSHSAGLSAAVELLLRSWREDKRISEVWMLPNVPPLLRTLVISWVRISGLKLLSWEGASAAQG